MRRLLACTLLVSAFVLGAGDVVAAPLVDPSCACGDADANGAIDDDDVQELRQKLAGLIADVTAPEKCQVASGGGCGLLDAVVIARDLASQAPGIQQVCSAAAASVCQDASSTQVEPNDPSVLPDGPDAIGGIGDYVLSNGRIRAAIDATGIDASSLGGAFPLANVWAPTGGNLVDLASTDTGNDQFLGMTQAVVGRDTIASGLAGVAYAFVGALVDSSADFITDGVQPGDSLLITTGANAGVELTIAVVADPNTIGLFVPPGVSYVDDAAGSVYVIRRTTSDLANVVVYDTAEFLDDQGLPVSSHSGDTVRLRVSGAILARSPADLPTGVVSDPATGRLNSGGSPIEVETTYTLRAGSRALEVETRVTNPSDGGIAYLDAVSDVIVVGGLDVANLSPWSALSGSVAQGLVDPLPMPFAALVGRGEPGASYAVVDVEAGQLWHTAEGSTVSIQRQLRERDALSPGESFVWRRAIAVGEANDAGAVDEAVRRLAAATDRLTPGGTTVPNPYGATAMISGSVFDASERTRVTAYQLSPALIYDPGAPAGVTGQAGFYPSILYGIDAPPIAFATPDPVSGAYQLVVPSGFPGLVGSGPDELLVPPGLEGGISTSSYLVEVDSPGIDPVAQIVEVSAGGGAVADFDLVRDAIFARLDLVVTDGVGGPLPARVVIRGADPDGLGPAPATPDPDFGDLPRASGQANVVHLADGTGSVYVPPGAYRVFVSRGLEYSLDRFPAPGEPLDFVLVSAGQVVSAAFSLERLLDSAALPDPATVGDPFAAFDQDDTYSNLGWSVNTTRGWTFSVTAPLVVEQLGFWDSGEDGLLVAHDVGLWIDDGTLLTSVTVPVGTEAPLQGMFRWVTTPPVALAPGTTYVIGAYWPAFTDSKLGAGENVVVDAHVTQGEGRATNATGLAFPPLSSSVDLSANFRATAGFESPLRRLVSADLRVQSEGSSGSPVPAEDRVIAHLASGVEVLVAADPDRLADLGPAVAALDAAHPAVGVASLLTEMTGLSTEGRVPIVVPGVLNSPNTIGSFGAWPLTFDPDAPRRGAPPDEYREPADLFDQLRAAGAAVIALHTPRYPVLPPPLPPFGAGFFTNGNDTFPQPNTGTASLASGGYPTPLDTSSGAFTLLQTPRTLAGTTNLDFDLIELDSGRLTAIYDINRLDFAALVSSGQVRTATASPGTNDLVPAAGFPRTFVFAPGDASADLASLDLAAFNQTLLPSFVQASPATNQPATRRPGAGPDAMEVIASSGPVVYVEVDADEDGVFEGQPGDLVADDGDGSVDVRLTVLAAPWVPTQQAWIRINGYESVAAPLTGLGGSVFDATPWLLPIVYRPDSTPYSTDLADVVRLRQVFTLPLPPGSLGDYWLSASARGTVAAYDGYTNVVLPDPTFTHAIGFTNPVFIDVDGDGVFDPNGVP